MTTKVKNCLDSFKKDKLDDLYIHLRIPKHFYSDSGHVFSGEEAMLVHTVFPHHSHSGTTHTRMADVNLHLVETHASSPTLLLTVNSNPPTKTAKNDERGIATNIIVHTSWFPSCALLFFLLDNNAEVHSDDNHNDNVLVPGTK